MTYKILSVAILSALSMNAFADKAYWSGSDGGYVKDRNGYCVRTINWTAEAAIAGCEGDKAAARSTDDAASKAADDSASSAAPAAAAGSSAAVAATADEEETMITLSSGTTFELGGSELSAEGKAEIAGLVAQYEGKTADSVIIEGHTDSSGDAAFNQQLSEKRAEAVKAELVANGADPAKIKTVGFGESKPIADNATREGRAKNRRVEIRVEGIKDKK